ncbi:MAG: glutaredoxin domain-containing protein [Candidatus Shapirobacteria bacterium]
MKKNKKQITIYSTPTCHYCNVAKEFFKDNKINFKELNVATDLDARKDMVEKSGQMGVPVIIFGKTIVVGFGPEVGEEIKKYNEAN